MKKYRFLTFILSFIPIFLFFVYPLYSDTTSDSTGFVSILTSAPADAVKITVKLSGNNLHDANSYDLIKTGEHWQGIIGNIPSGINRIAEVIAYNKVNQEVYLGSAVFTVITNHVVTVLINLLPVEPSLDYNIYAPAITNINILPQKIGPGESTSLEINAIDPNGNPEEINPLSYLWTSRNSSGTFNDIHSITPIWTAPETGGEFEITAAVTDTEGYSSQISFLIEVDDKYKTDSIPIDLQCDSPWSWYYYYAPRITSISADPQKVCRGKSTQLMVEAYDKKNLPLSYKWYTDCPGVFDNQNTADPIFTVNSKACSRYYKMLAVVSNGRYCSLALTIIKVPSTCDTDNHPPVIVSITASPSEVNPGGTVNLNVIATDADNDPLTYSWQTGCPGSFSNSTITNPVFSVSSTAAPGDYSVKVMVSDGHDSVSSSTIIKVKSVNNPPQIIEITANPQELAPGGHTNLNVTALDADNDPLTYNWQTNCPGSFSSATVTNPVFTVSSSAAVGIYQINITVSDGKNSITGSIQLTVKKANNLPVISSITITPSEVFPGESTNLNVTASDPDGDPLTFLWQTGCPGNFSSSTITNPVFTAGSTATPGNYQINLTVSDGKGNVTGKVILTVKKLNSLPIISEITANPAEVFPGDTVNLSVTATDPDSDPLTYAWQTGCPGSFNSKTVMNPVFTVSQTAVPGVYTFTVTVSDGKDSVNSQVSITVIKPNTPPVITKVTATPQELTAGQSTNLSVTATDADGDSLTYLWQASCSGNFDSNTKINPVFIIGTSVVPGSYQITVKVSDGKTTVSGSCMITVIKTNTAPVISAVTANPDEVIAGNATNLTVTATDPDGDALTYSWQTSCPGNFSSSTIFNPVFTVSANALAGTYLITINVSDGKETVQGKVLLTVKRPNQLPVINDISINPAEVFPGNTANLSVSASDPDGDPLTYSWLTNCPGSFDNAAATNPVFTVAANTTAGTYSFTVTVSDGKGSTNSTISLKVKKLNNPPVLTNISADPLEVYPGETINLEAQATDADGDPLTYQWQTNCSGNFNSITSAQCIFSVSASCTPGSYLFSVTVSDGQENILGSVSVIIKKPNNAPEITEITANPLEIFPGEDVALNVTASDPDGDPLTYSWQSGCPGIFDNPIIVSPIFTAATNASPGSYQIKVTVSDGILETSAEVTITVKKANMAPVISEVTADPIEVIAGEITQLDVKAIDPDGDVLTYSWQSSCPGTFSSKNIYNPTFTVAIIADENSYPVTVTVSDGIESVTGTVTIKVILNNNLPVIKNITAEPTRIDKGGSISLHVEAEDYDGDNLTFLWTSTCSGTFDNPYKANPLFTVDPSVNYGECTINVSVSDGKGESFGSIQINIWNPDINLPPVIISTFQSSDKVVGGKEVVLKVRASDPENGNLSFQWFAPLGKLSMPVNAVYSTYTESTVMWIAPLTSINPINIKVTVTDNQALSTVVNFLPINVIDAAPHSDPTISQKLMGIDSMQNGKFGYTTAINDQIAIIGAYGLNAYTGGAYIYELNGSKTWTQTAQLTASDAQISDYFGYAVSVWGNYAVIGAYGEDGGNGDPKRNCGAVYVFKRNESGVWTQEAILHASDGITGDMFGTAVAICGNYIVVGARYKAKNEDSTMKNCGTAYIFECDNNGIWQEKSKLYASDGAKDDYFGIAVAIHGNNALIGASGKDLPGAADAGCVYLFQRNTAGLWSEKTILKAPDAQTGDDFGISVAIDAENIIIGADREDGGYPDATADAGAAYIFTQNTSTSEYYVSAILHATDKEAGDQFGSTVSICGNYALVGAKYEDGGPGSTHNNTGVAYLFERGDNGAWANKKAFYALDQQDLDMFGTAVAISYQYGIIGAPGEDGGPGDPIYGAGAAYILNLDN